MVDYVFDSTAYPVCTCCVHLQAGEITWWCPAHGIVFNWGYENYA